jgi:ribose 5-phosphate isomerase A
MMPKSPVELGREKALVASRAASWIASGMRVGIGSGATVALFVEALGMRRAREGLEVQCVVASEATARLARAAGMKVRRVRHRPAARRGRGRCG